MSAESGNECFWKGFAQWKSFAARWVYLFRVVVNGYEDIQLRHNRAQVCSAGHASKFRTYQGYDEFTLDALNRKRA